VWCGSDWAFKCTAHVSPHPYTTTARVLPPPNNHTHRTRHHTQLKPSRHTQAKQNINSTHVTLDGALVQVPNVESAGRCQQQQQLGREERGQPHFFTVPSEGACDWGLVCKGKGVISAKPGPIDRTSGRRQVQSNRIESNRIGWSSSCVCVGVSLGRAVAFVC
jgi:hypothetical protein